jgi:hypothetical protein
MTKDGELQGERVTLARHFAGGAEIENVHPKQIDNNQAETSCPACSFVSIRTRKPRLSALAVPPSSAALGG